MRGCGHLWMRVYIVWSTTVKKKEKKRWLTFLDIHMLLIGHCSSTYIYLIMIDNVLRYYVSQGLPPWLYVPATLRTTYLDFYHSHKLSGHFGSIKFSNGYVATININVPLIMPHVPGCENPAIPGQIIDTKEPFEMFYWNLMGLFPVSIHGNKYILVITAYLMHWSEAITLLDSTTSTVASALLQHVIFSHGCPQQLLSN